MSNESFEKNSNVIIVALIAVVAILACIIFGMHAKEKKESQAAGSEKKEVVSLFGSETDSDDADSKAEEDNTKINTAEPIEAAIAQITAAGFEQDHVYISPCEKVMTEYDYERIEAKPFEISGCVTYAETDLDLDGEDELLVLDYDGDSAFRLCVYEREQNEMVLSAEKECGAQLLDAQMVEIFFGTVEAGGKNLILLHEDHLRCLNADGSYYNLCVYSYDGNNIINEYQGDISGSEFSGSESFSRAEAKRLRALGLEKTAETLDYELKPNLQDGVSDTAYFYMEHSSLFDPGYQWGTLGNVRLCISNNESRAKELVQSNKGAVNQGSGNLSYHYENSKLGFRIGLPEIYQNEVSYSEYKDGVTFKVNRCAEETGGVLFYIGAQKFKDDEEAWPMDNYRVLDTVGGYTYFMGGPTDVEFTEETADLYMECYSYFDEIAASFEFIGRDGTYDYVIPDSDVRILDETDLYGLTPEELRIARNEILARHGRKFKDETLQEYFDSMIWYYGTIDADKFLEKQELNDIEIKNMYFIADFENRH